MADEQPWWGYYLFMGFIFLALIFVAVGITLIIVFVIDGIFYPMPDNLDLHGQKAYNRRLSERVGWKIPLGIFIVTYLGLVIYNYFRYLRKPKD